MFTAMLCQIADLAPADQARWVRENPIEFCRRLLQHPLEWPGNGKPDEQARSLFLAATAEGKHIAAIGGHSTRKDYTLALADLWQIFAYPGTWVILTGPKLEQVKMTQLFYLAKVLRESGFPASEYRILAESIEFPSIGSRILCYTTSTTEEGSLSHARFTGIHRDRMIIHLTEATSIRNATWEQVSTLGAHADFHVFATANAIYSPGHWLVNLSRRRPDNWYVCHLSSYDSPYCQSSWIEDRKAEGWLPGTTLYSSRILGEFPAEATEVLIPEQWIVDAQNLETIAPFYKGTALGVDVAGAGSDLSIVQEIAGQVASPSFVVPKRDPRMHTVEVADAVEHAICRRGIEPKHVKVDVIGVGLGVVGTLRERSRNVIGVNFAASPFDKQRFVNQRAEAYWNVRERIRKGELRLPKDDRFLARDLCDIRYEESVRHGGRIKIEDKDEIRKRLGYSPDRADALALALYMEAPIRAPDAPAPQPGRRLVRPSNRPADSLQTIRSRLDPENPLPKWMDR